MNQHYGAAQAIISTAVPGDTLEGVAALQGAQVESALAEAYEQRTANLIAYLAHCEGDEYATVRAEIQERLDLPGPPEPEPVQHFRVGAARCNCGFDAFKINGIMVDYSEEFQRHLVKNR